jgi:hypothetical protein
MNTVDQAFLAYSRNEISNTAVVRAMAEYDLWHVPMFFAADNLGKTVAEKGSIISAEFGGHPRTLYLFTDGDAILRALHLPLGAFAGYCSGAHIFEHLTATDFDQVHVNPGSPRELTFHIGSDLFGLVGLVTQVVRLEQALASASATYVPFLEIRNHPGYMIAVTRPDNVPATTVVEGLDGRCAMVFTSPDRFELFKLRQTPEQCANMATVTLPGDSLFRQLQRFDVSGVTINPDCPGSTTLPAFLFPRIVAGE